MLKRIAFALSFLSAATLFCVLMPACKSNPAKTEDPVFKKIASAESGITFTNRLDENYQKNYFDTFAYVYNGAGVATGDFNNDGLMDIYFTGNEVANKLYLNKGGMKFSDISQSAGVEGTTGWDNGVTLVDINNDGWLDIYVCKGGTTKETEAERRNLLYINQGNLTFKEEAKQYGLDDPGYSIHAAFFDMDNDNDLDMYLTNRPQDFYLGLSQMVAGKRTPPDYARDKLYRNDNRKFTEIGKQAGINHNFGYALSVVTSDLNNDGYTDIFVSNDYADNDYIYINQRNGTFKDEVKTMTNHLSLFSMGADIADINNDGLEDILVMEMLPENYKRSKVSMPRMDVEGFWAIVDSGFHKQYMHNALHLNHGNGFFSDVSQMAGISKTEWSWSTLAADFDNDGQRDIFVANGYRRDLFDGDIQQKQDMYIQANAHKYSSSAEMFEKGFKEYMDIYSPIKARNYLFKNKGDLQFENVSEAWGFKDSTFSNGAAVADFDNDGDLDMIINNLDGESDLYENIVNNKNNYLRIKLEGPEKNRDGIGAKLALYYDGKMQQFFQQKLVRGYLSTNEPAVHFGLGKTAKLDSIVVVWPDGKSNSVKNITTNQVLKVNYKEAVSGINYMPVYNPLFVETTDQILSAPFLHKENKYDEYVDQVLLPHEFSRSGPFVTTADVNGDGMDDFYIGGAKDQSGVLYIQQNGKFTPRTIAAFEADKKYEDMGAAFFDADKDGDMDLYVVSGGSEFDEGSPMYQDRLYLNDGKGNFSKANLSIPVTASSGSCVAVFDMDADGDLDIFRGGEVLPHKYPQAPQSYLLVNDKGTFVDRTSDIAPELSRVGMVKSALWTDLNGDKRAELVIAGEWMPIKVFEYKKGKMKDQSSSYGLQQTEGWWDKLVADDIDGDGDMDLVAGNLGENYKFKASEKKPFEVWAKDFDGNGTNDIFLARHLNDNTIVPIRGRECTSQQCPMIAQKFPTYLSFAESDISGILGEEEMKTALHHQAHLFSTVVFINDKGKFISKRLPTEAQLSTVNGIIVKDFDGDGKKDILLAGNKFDVEVETTPADASPGLFLKGLGDMNFKPYKPMESGFFAPYNVKDIQPIKLANGSGILVSANNDRLRIFATKK
ncbi:VCBS repeat-containing protein [Sediminibacterium sp.]|uniref:VCBS repeat-containing protein n=1 Tax=Sediminibacterium sp. TaxID=1917865 RepID=UPI0025EABAC8|nr:VCBS repeat-containing protein [Sediminibacterium sp.]MBW0176649.1 VCBS repeat-containing protein [Sediminibacterium sp.]